MQFIARHIRFKPPYRISLSHPLSLVSPILFGSGGRQLLSPSTKELNMKATVPCLIIAVTLGVAHAAAAQQAIAGDAADMQYCRTLARTFQSLHPAQQAPRASDTVMLNGCDGDTKKTIAALEHRMTDQKIDLPQHPGVAQTQAPLK
jgi:hypothetical protein